MTVKQVKVYAPASIANLGPGFDVFGIALDNLGDTLDVQVVNDPSITIMVEGFEDASIPVNSINNSAGAALEYLSREKKLLTGFIVKITKGIPPGKGMGSSGASAAAAVVAANRLLRLELTQSELVKAAAEGESAVAGSPHADNVSASLLGGFVVVGENYEVTRLDMPEIGIVIVIPHVNYENKTRMSRELLPKQVDLKKAVINIGYASRMVAAVAIKDPILFGRSIRDFLVEPYRAQMIPNFNVVKKAALEAGAYGCSISGGGPSLFAVGKNPSKIGKAMSEAFGDTVSSILVTKPSNKGTRVVN